MLRRRLSLRLELLVYIFMTKPKNTEHRIIQLSLAFSFGVIFLGIILYIAFIIPNPTVFQYQIFRITLALAAGGIAAMIPGILNVNLPSFLTAGGALAVFVVVYFYSPAQIAIQEIPPDPSKTATNPNIRLGEQPIETNLCAFNPPKNWSFYLIKDGSFVNGDIVYKNKNNELLIALQSNQGDFDIQALSLNRDVNVPFDYSKSASPRYYLACDEGWNYSLELKLGTQTITTKVMTVKSDEKQEEIKILFLLFNGEFKEITTKAKFPSIGSLEAKGQAAVDGTTIYDFVLKREKKESWQFNPVAPYKATFRPIGNFKITNVQPGAGKYGYTYQMGNITHSNFVSFDSQKAFANDQFLSIKGEALWFDSNMLPNTKWVIMSSPTENEMFIFRVSQRK